MAETEDRSGTPDREAVPAIERLRKRLTGAIATFADATTAEGRRDAIAETQAALFDDLRERGLAQEAGLVLKTWYALADLQDGRAPDWLQPTKQKRGRGKPVLSDERTLRAMAVGTVDFLLMGLGVRLVAAAEKVAEALGGSIIAGQVTDWREDKAKRDSTAFITEDGAAHVTRTLAARTVGWHPKVAEKQALDILKTAARARKGR